MGDEETEADINHSHARGDVFKSILQSTLEEEAEPDGSHSPARSSFFQDILQSTPEEEEEAEPDVSHSHARTDEASREVDERIYEVGRSEAKKKASSDDEHEERAPASVPEEPFVKKGRRSMSSCGAMKKEIYRNISHIRLMGLKRRSSASSGFGQSALKIQRHLSGRAHVVGYPRCSSCLKLPHDAFDRFCSACGAELNPTAGESLCSPMSP